MACLQRFLFYNCIQIFAQLQTTVINFIQEMFPNLKKKYSFSSLRLGFTPSLCICDCLVDEQNIDDHKKRLFICLKPFICLKNTRQSLNVISASTTEQSGSSSQSRASLHSHMGLSNTAISPIRVMEKNVSFLP